MKKRIRKDIYWPEDSRSYLDSICATNGCERGKTSTSVFCEKCKEKIMKNNKKLLLSKGLVKGIYNK